MEAERLGDRDSPVYLDPSTGRLPPNAPLDTLTELCIDIKKNEKHGRLNKSQKWMLQHIIRNSVLKAAFPKTFERNALNDPFFNDVASEMVKKIQVDGTRPAAGRSRQSVADDRKMLNDLEALVDYAQK